MAAAIVALSGIGVVGVGIFPAQYSTPHAIAAFLAISTGGLSAIVVAAVVRGPFRCLSVSLDVVTLAAMVLFVALGGSTALGIGGLERWITYPTQIWVIAFGGHLLGAGDELVAVDYREQQNNLEVCTREVIVSTSMVGKIRAAGSSRPDSTPRGIAIARY